MSKGSKRRPKQISDEEEQARWDAIFKGSVSEVVLDESMEEAAEVGAREAPAVPLPTLQRSEVRG